MSAPQAARSRCRARPRARRCRGRRGYWDDSALRRRALLLEAEPLLLIMRAWHEHLERHVAADLEIAGAQDSAHSAAAQLENHLVAPCEDLRHGGRGGLFVRRYGPGHL